MPTLGVMNRITSDRRYVLGLLMLVGLFNYIDRMCMSILIVPIRAELGLSDTQIGVLTGIAFSLVYTLMAVPIARVADRGSRKLVIAVALAVWSLMTAACGLVGSFLALAVLRMGVAIGEAGCIPATQALLSEHYSPAERPRAVATWTLVFPVGTLLGIALGGWLADGLGWRRTFVLFGITGLLLVPAVLFTLREPERTRAATDSPRAFDGIVASFSLLWSTRAYRYLLLGGALIAYPLNAALFWSAPFYNRVFDVPMSELKWMIALLSGGAGAIGLFGSGYLADRLGRRDMRWHMWVPAISGFAVAPFMLLQFFATDLRLSLASGAIAVLLLNAFLPPQAASAQSLVPPQLRALAAATIVLVAGLVGTALGPFLTGLLSDLLAARLEHQADSLRYAIGCSSLLAVAGGMFFVRAGADYRSAHAAVNGL